MAGVGRRRRPRVRSVNFRRLKWCLVREAALRIICPGAMTPFQEQQLRARLNALDVDRVLVRAGVVLALHPERREWPGGPA